MPYQSDKQRKYMHAQHPEIAAKWDKESRPQMKGEQAGVGHKNTEIKGGAKELATGAGIAALVTNHKPLTNQALRLNDTIANRRRAKWTGAYGMGRRGERVEAPQPTKVRRLRTDPGQTKGAARRAAKKESYASRRRLSGHLNQITATQNRAGRIIRVPGKITAMGAGIATAAPLMYHGGHRIASEIDRVEGLDRPKGRVRKAETKNTQDWNRAAVGGTLGGAAYVGAGFAGKPYEKRLRNRIKTGEGDPDRATQYRQTEAAHAKKMGMTGKEKLGDPKFVPFYRKYPKELPGAGYRRTLSYTHGGKTQLIGSGLTTAAAATAAVKMGRRRDQKKGTLVRKDDIPAMGEYRYLLPNIRQEVEWGIPEERQNPISPVQMMAAANLAASGYADVKRRWPIGKKKRRERGMLKLGIAQQLGNQPFGFGVAS